MQETRLVHVCWQIWVLRMWIRCESIKKIHGKRWLDCISKNECVFRGLGVEYDKKSPRSWLKSRTMNITALIWVLCHPTNVDDGDLNTANKFNYFSHFEIWWLFKRFCFLPVHWYYSSLCRSKEKENKIADNPFLFTRPHRLYHGRWECTFKNSEHDGNCFRKINF